MSLKIGLLLAVVAVASAIDVKNLLAKMTIEDKCGQMTQLYITAVGRADPDVSGTPIDMEKLRNAVKNYKIGSILGTPYSGTGTPTAAQWQKTIKLIQDVALNETELRIPVIYGTDSIHSAFVSNSVEFPHALGVAASFNLDLIANMSRVIAMETRVSGVRWNFSPVLDVGRHPLWPRLYETYGEDVLLVSKVAEAFIKAHHGRDFSDRNTAGTCLKHFVGYSYAFNGRDRSVAYIPESVLREVFLPPFEAGVKAGALTVMLNSGDVNGLPGHANYQYLTQILKQEWNFTGFTVSDWEDVKRLHVRDRVAVSPEDAVRLAVMAGVDMSMVPFDFSFTEHCIKLAREGEQFRQRVDDATYRILHVKNVLGLFDDPYGKPADLENVGKPESEDLNLRAAQESVILAKNDAKLLPLSSNKRLLVVGPTADSMNALNGGWSYSWPGGGNNDDPEYAKKKQSVLKAIRNRSSSSSNVIYYKGADFEGSTVTDLDEIAAAASKVDAVVLCIGEGVYAETGGNIDDLSIAESQLTLARVLYELGKPIILIFTGGRPRIITEIVEHSAAVILAFYPGSRGGEAIADVLYGIINPSAKLPITYPIGPNTYMNYDYKSSDSSSAKTSILYKFGHGLSYTEFEYADLTLNTSIVKPPEGISGSVRVKNTGSRSGKEIVIVYLNDAYSSLVTRPTRQMKAFTKVSLEPNEEQTVNFELSLKDMSFIDTANKRVFEKGRFNVYVEALRATFNLECETIVCEYRR